ncbi:hypothetical protein QR680_003440 [Steinernema hermaphroditum]|uniref:Molybdenum cofactor sulfurase middle domain-containing protein n=1 Tax=Steinernema hermaphroditum TaxID=289476 RepID=A0AA39H7R7_9BILA|nr:hypothetical protein QR680_003440 [Steinernema hermaphroditum]
MAADLFGRRDVRLGLAVASSALIAIPVYQYVRRAYFEWRYPWVEIGKVEHLYVYPIKSCKGNEVETLKCELLGPSSGEDFDRFFLVIDDETNHFYTSRQMPKLMLLEAHVKENVLELRTPDGKQLGVNLEKILKDHITRPSTYTPV